jgi:hypothetical protein
MALFEQPYDAVIRAVALSLETVPLLFSASAMTVHDLSCTRLIAAA